MTEINVEHIFKLVLSPLFGLLLVETLRLNRMKLEIERHN